MRKRIGQLARGKFECVKPIVSFSEEPIVIDVLEEMDYSGDFTITSINQEPLRGIIYSTNERMECLTPQFDGEEVKIRYRFHSRGLHEGETQDGNFVIVCNGSEYSLSFRATVTRLYPDSSKGQIKNLYDFACLAKENWEEAYQLFYHKSFASIIDDREVKELMVYRGIMAAKPSNQNLEEFLIGIRKKNQLEFSISEQHPTFYKVYQTQRERLHIRKNGWGYIEIRVSADADFLEPQKKVIRPEDFIGSECELDYMIHVEKLHSGRNYGRLIFQDAYQTVTYEITVHNPCENEDRELHKQIQEYKVGIMELYQAYRLKRIVTGVWANETVEILNHLRAIVPEEPMYELMKAQVFIINRQRQEAEWILDEFRRVWKDKEDPIWGYYLYLLTLMEREPSYVDRMTREIELIFRENPDSRLLFWVLLFLEEQYYNNSAAKLKAIASWIMDDCSSPYFYLEAYYLMTKEPYLVRELGSFELRVLRWAVKEKALSKELAVQIFQLLEMSKEFSPKIYGLICAAYEVNPKPEYIGMICGYLIKGQQFLPKYHHWFEEGIELELRITGLYEAYLLSMDEHEVTKVPQIIQMYFQYESRLPYKKMAVLYNNIIASRKESPEVYEKYRKAMGRFAMEQVEQEHMDDNLAVIYTDMLDLGLVNKDIAHCLARILFTHKLYVHDERMVRAWIYQRQMKEPQIVPIMEHTAYFQLYSQEYVILFEDARGNRYVGSVLYQVQGLMNPQLYLHKCMTLAPDELPYIISHFDRMQSYLNFASQDEVYFSKIIKSTELSPEYRAQMISEMLQYYKGRDDVPLQDMLLALDLGMVSDEVRRFVLELMISTRMYDSAYDCIREYGLDQISAASKVTLATNIIHKNQMADDDFLTGLCYSAFDAGKYNDVILGYLCNYYVGPTENMFEVWKAAEKFGADTFELEERVLSQMMYANTHIQDVDQLFENYYKNGGKELIVLAFLTIRAHDYFVDELPLSQLLVDIIESRYVYHMELNDACKLALLKYLAGIPQLSKAQYQIADELLSEFTCRNMIFAFYKRLDMSLIQKYHLYDKVILEYRADPQKHVVLHYSRDEDGAEFLTEDMTNVYEGIFVKQFVMFFGEMIQYYISEEQGTEVQVTQSSRLTNNDVYNQKDESRYGLINQMLISNTLMERESLKEYMIRYEQLDEMTRNVFHLQ